MFNKEYVICAAIHIDDGKVHKEQPKNISSGMVICGRRHNNCFRTYSDIKGKKLTVNEKITAGFLTSKDRFLGRKEALEIAILAGQTTPHKECKEISEWLGLKSDVPDILISEDLYSD